jgi:hypothetical protein
MSCEYLNNDSFEEDFGITYADMYDSNDIITDDVDDTNDENDIQDIIDENDIIKDPIPNPPLISKTYGFIISRHVNSERTNKYWNRCVKLIRTLYPYRLIVIIDDNSNQRFLKADHDYKNLIVVKSEYPGRGELLPYIYFARNKWFDKAVIIHDSIFFHKRIAFETINLPAISLWHFDKGHNKTHLQNNLRLAGALNHRNMIQNCLINDSVWCGCFGVQSFIKHSFLLHIMNKYNINNLLNVVKCREDRCSLERIFAVIFYLELKKVNISILGNMNRGSKFGYTYEQYINTLRLTGTVPQNVVKVFTGR